MITLDVVDTPCCMLCGNVGAILHSHLRDQIFSAPGEWSHRACRDCQLIWLDPQPTPRSIPLLYAEYFPKAEFTDHRSESPLRATLRQLALQRLGYARRDAHATLPARTLARLQMVREIVAGDVAYLPAKTGGEVFDVGCGTGDILIHLKAAGWNVSGLEIDPVTAAIASRRLDREIQVGAIEDANLEADRYDAIIISHVVEHLMDPLAALSKCARALKPGGQMILLTPNTSSLGRRLFAASWLHWDAPRHTFLFNTRSLRMLVENVGLRVTEQRTLSRKARWSWRAARMIKKGITPTSEEMRARKRERAMAAAFHVFEHTATRFFDYGEELMFVCTKDS